MKLYIFGNDLMAKDGKQTQTIVLNVLNDIENSKAARLYLQSIADRINADMTCATKLIDEATRKMQNARYDEVNSRPVSF